MKTGQVTFKINDEEAILKSLDENDAFQRNTEEKAAVFNWIKTEDDEIETRGTLSLVDDKLILKTEQAFRRR